MHEPKLKNRIDVVFVQSNPSQLDEPFYAMLFRATGRIGLALLNAGARDRRAVDPELGLVPVFPAFSPDVPSWLFGSEEEGGVRDMLRTIMAIRPKLVVVQDQSWRAKIRIAIACRQAGIAVAMRSDKNAISAEARRGTMRRLEGSIVRSIFSCLAPVSRLTYDYYGWTDPQTCWWFPYPTLAGKFALDAERRATGAQLRHNLGIAAQATVFLVVAKFVPRENPAAAIRAFARAGLNDPNAALIMVGAGRMERELKDLARMLGVWERVHFAGYVPYADLQRYFWASNVLVHLPFSEPWGVSVQDALVAEMALVASNKVGAAISHLEGPLQKYVVAPEDIDSAARLMAELCDVEGVAAAFATARAHVLEGFTVETLAAAWARRMETM